MKPKAYIETLTLSYLTAKPSSDIRVLANRTPPETFHGMIKRDVEKWRRVVREAKLTFTS